MLSWVKCHISTNSLFDFLNKSNKKLPPSNGTIEDKGRNGNLRIFVYKFHKLDVTPCSKASADDFIQCDDFEKRIFSPDIKLIKNVGWSFFSLDSNPDLNLEEYFVDAKGLHIRPLFKYRLPEKEADRINCLYNALVKDLSLKTMNITQIVPPGNTEHFCRFSGGGDILISKKTELMVISSLRDSNSSQQRDDDSLYPSQPSPKEATECISGFTVEGKKMEAKSYESLKHQLFADVILNCVSNFMANVNEYSEAFIRSVDSVNGYGTAYTGTGLIGFYKVEIRFGHAVKMVTKLELNQYQRPTSAAYLDSAVEYFTKIE